MNINVHKCNYSGLFLLRFPLKLYAIDINLHFDVCSVLVGMIREKLIYPNLKLEVSMFIPSFKKF